MKNISAPTIMKNSIGLLLTGAALGLVIFGTSRGRQDEVRKQPNPQIELSGEKARHYLEGTADGQALMQAVIAAQFGLKARDQSPFDEESGPGHLGMSHDQNLNAWFAHDGVTVRPTRSQSEQDRAWSVFLEPKEYGYGEQLKEVPPIVSRKVDGNRIEYQRRGRKSEVGSQILGEPPLVEWYVNRPEGIEQGFTLKEPPRRQNYVSSEELRLVMAVQGELLAQVNQGGQAIELSDNEGKRRLSYSKLVAFDAAGKRLAARMEASADGRQIALVVDDREAAYPLVIDPILTDLEEKLDAGGRRQIDARFGFAVAIDSDRAVVGAWRENVPVGLTDAGAVYTFTRTNLGWSSATREEGGNQNTACGWSVAISGNRFAYGCPGADNQAGRAYVGVFASGNRPTEITPSPNSRAPGDQFGYSVALSSSRVAVGAPFNDFGGADSGRIHFFTFDSNANAVPLGTRSDFFINGRFGTSVAISGDRVVAGGPNSLSGQGRAVVYEASLGSTALLAVGREAGDNVGDSVDISGDTVVFGAWGDDDTGTDAGAAYVFVRNSDGTWSQQQKLTASDGRPDDHFSEHAVTIEGDIIVVGATSWDSQTSGDNAGAAYVFTRSGTLWTRQTAIYGNPAENFGIGVDLSGDTALIGARGADANGDPRTGAAYVYRLPPATLANVSTRLLVETGDNALFGGFTVTGTQPKKVMVRAIGPSLPLSGALADPQLQIFDSSGAEIAFNNNWRDATNRQEIIDSTIAPGNDLESAVLNSFNPGAYTAIVRGVNGTTGAGLIEAYDLDTAANSKLVNIATRGLVQTGDDVLIAGTIVVGWYSQKIMVRAIGPSLTLPGRILDPTLELRDSNGVLLEANDNWGDSPNKQAIIDTTIPPSHDLESAILRTLSPAPYTAIVRGVNATTGIAVVEVYALSN